MTFRFGFLVFPGVQQLDLTGPFEVFASARDTQVDLVWKTRTPVASATGLAFTPSLTFAEAPAFDVFCVPGGGGVNALLEDPEVLDFVARQAQAVRFMTAVCTGTLVLGAAGLLAGRRATTHWNARDFLPAFGAIPADGRVVQDGSLITAGGVTSGIDFGLTVLAALMGQAEAECVQLALEYAPAPPFGSGHPDTATPAVLDEARRRIAGSRQAREVFFQRYRARQG